MLKEIILRYLFFLIVILINASFLNAKSIMQIEVSGSTKGIIMIELFEKLSEGGALLLNRIWARWDARTPESVAF